MLIVQTFYISSGAKNAMHTLRMRRDGGNINPAFLPDYYIKNLAVSVEEAQRKAMEHFDAFKERVGGDDENRILRIEIEPEYEVGTRRGRLSMNDTIAMEAIERGVVPFGKHKLTDDGKEQRKLVDLPDSYVLFFADKAIEANDNVVMAAFANACLGIALDKGLIAKRDEKRAERERLDALSQHVGTIGERREFVGEVVTSFFKRYFDHEPTNGYYINKVRTAEGLIVAIGSVKIGDVGETVRFKATIKAHDEYKGVKSTKVNRPKIIEAKGE